MPDNSHVAVITGASSGIGETTAKLLSQNNITVLLGARSMKKMDKLANQINGAGGNAKSFFLDLNDDESIHAFSNEINQIYTVTTLINNSGYGKFDKIENASTEEWDKMMNVNLRGAFILSKAFIPSMKKRKKGNLVFINSVAGRHGYPFSAGYVASKFGLRGLAESLRNELRQEGIKVSSVYPGAVDSDFWENVNVDFPRSDMMNPQEVAEAILFAINQQGSAVLEDIVIRRVEGDF